jgi:ribose/xylose/arabinose/galactoside ABC-type transport system permease subunit
MTTSRWPSSVLRRGLAVNSGVRLLLLLLVALALFAPGFLDWTNVANVSRTAAILALAAYGQALVILIGGIDLSIGSIVALMSVVIVLAMDLGTFVAMSLGVLTALVAGAINGIAVAWFRMPAFLVTLAMLTALHGLAGVLVGGIPVEAPPGDAFSWLSAGSIGPIPVPVALAALGFIVLLILLRWTVLGRSWFLIGANLTAAQAAGIRTRRATFLAFLVGAGFVAAAGLILTSRVHSGQPDLYPSLPFEAIAACAIGGLPLTGGDARAGRVLVGVGVVVLAENGLQLLDYSAATQLVVVGVLTVVAVLAQHRRPTRLRWWQPKAVTTLGAGS